MADGTWVDDAWRNKDHRLCVGLIQIAKTRDLATWLTYLLFSYVSTNGEYGFKFAMC